MFYLGEIYKDGLADLGVAQNLSAAVEHFSAAAEQKHFRSMYELGVLYRDGRGVEDDCERAVALLKYVAECDNVKFDLEAARTAFEEGHAERAFLMYSHTAEQGYVNGQINAAWLASQGYGDHGGQLRVQDRDALAFRFLALAASQKHSRSLRTVGDYYWYQRPLVAGDVRAEGGHEVRALVLRVLRDREDVEADGKRTACDLYEMASFVALSLLLRARTGPRAQREQSEADLLDCAQ